MERKREPVMAIPVSPEVASDLPRVPRTPAEAATEFARIVWSSTEFDNRGWRLQAACRETNAKVFFPVGATGRAVKQIARAKAICAGCPVRLTCLEYALATHQDDGVWGGYDEAERRDLRRKWRRSGCPELLEIGPLPPSFSAGGESRLMDRTPEAS